MEQPSSVGPSRIDGEEIGTDQYRLSNLDGGCGWDAKNYSCAYDVVFMVFYGMYGLSSSTWRTCWRRESPLWNELLGNCFKTILGATAGGQSTPLQTSIMFSKHHDTFRTSLRASDPPSFPLGPVYASVVKILERLRSQYFPIPNLYQDLACTSCGARKDNACVPLSFLSEPVQLNPLLRIDDPQPLPLQVALSRLIETYNEEPHPQHRLCNVCKSPRKPKSTLRFAEKAWTWFELSSGHQSLLPSLELVPLAPVISRYTLQAIIYLGDLHFTARIRKEANIWWSYDSQSRNGAPSLETIATEERLRTFGKRLPAFLIYRRFDVND